VVRNFKTKQKKIERIDLDYVERDTESEKKKFFKEKPEGRKYVDNLDFEIIIKNLIDKKNRKNIRIILFN